MEFSITAQKEKTCDSLRFIPQLSVKNLFGLNGHRPAGFPRHPVEIV
jgi:hypothetical protein